MNETEILSVVLNFVLAITTIVFSREYKKFKNMFVTTAEAVKDDKVTWDEAKDIVKQLEEK